MKFYEYPHVSPGELVDKLDFSADPARLERILTSDRWKIKSKEINSAVEFGSIEDKRGNVRVEYENSGIYRNTTFKCPTRNIIVRLYDTTGDILLTVDQVQFWKSNNGTIKRGLSVGPSPYERKDGRSWADVPFIYQFNGFPFGNDGRMDPVFNVKGLPRIIDLEATISAFIDQVLKGHFDRPEIIRPKRNRAMVTSLFLDKSS